MSLPSQPLMLPQRGRYRHYSGPRYDVLGIAELAGTRSLLVICRPAITAATQLDAIPVESWNTPVRINGKTVPRFVKLAPPDEALALGEDWP
jgi:hypothetical protein